MFFPYPNFLIFLIEMSHFWHISQTVSFNAGMPFLFFSFFLSFFFLLFRAAFAAYGDSQGLNWSCSDWPPAQPQQRRIQAVSVTYITAHGNTGSLTH